MTFGELSQLIIVMAALHGRGGWIILLGMIGVLIAQRIVRFARAGAIG